MLTDAELVHYYVTYKQVNFNSTRKMPPRSQTSPCLSRYESGGHTGEEGKGRGRETSLLSPFCDPSCACPQFLCFKLACL